MTIVVYCLPPGDAIPGGAADSNRALQAEQLAQGRAGGRRRNKGGRTTGFSFPRQQPAWWRTVERFCIDNMETKERRDKFLRALHAEGISASPPGGSVVLPRDKRT